MSAFPPIGRLSKPTGPTGILSSSRKTRKDGGARPKKKSGLSAPQAAKMSRGGR